MKCSFDDPDIVVRVLIPDVMPIHWEEDGDEWLTHLHREFMAQLGGGGMSALGPHATDNFPQLHLEYRPNSDKASSVLVLVFEDGGLRVGVAERGDPNPSDRALWDTIIEGAFRRLGKSDVEYRWQALIAIAPGSNPAPGRFERSFDVGPLDIRPGEVELVEWTNGVSTPPSLNSASEWGSWPAIVEGHASAYEWDVAAKQAGRDAARLCALLSVCMGGTWVVREPPTQVAEGSEGFAGNVPTRLWWQDSSELRAESSPLAERADPPAWLGHAWNRITGHPYLEDACSMYHEGLILMADHPSFSLIAFVSCIETLSAKLFPVERCHVCNAVTGSGRRFRAALELVEDAATATELGRAYGPRSRTAHSGKLHGTELLGGAWTMPPLFAKDEFDFRWRVVYGLARASRRLLLRELDPSAG